MTALTGTRTLLRLAMRRDRLQLPIWLLALVGTLGASAASIVNLYGSEQERLAYVATNAGSAVARAFGGAIAGTGTGSVVTVETFSLIAVLAALMSIFAVVRHTRLDEETGRAELIGAGVVGRHAQLAAAMLLAIGANVLLAALSGLVVAANDLPVPGSFALGTGIGLVGITFAGFAAVAVQVFESARAARGAASATLGLAFLLRAAGDAMGTPNPTATSVTSAWPSWVSPIGWAQQVHPFAGQRWWTFAFPVLAFLLAFGVAVVLARHRDLGTGMIAVRPGRPTARRGLLSPLGLAWRLQRSGLLGWTIGMTVLGAASGAVGNEIDTLLRTSDQIADVIAGLGGADQLVDAYFGAMMSIIALATSGYAIQAMLRMRGEESGGSLEPVLACAVGRPRWAAAHITCAMLGVVIILLCAGASTALAYGAVTGDLSKLGGIVSVAAAQVPAVWVLAGLAVAVFGIAPHLSTTIPWMALVLVLFLDQLGQLLELPDVLLDVSPFAHVPATPGTSIEALPVLALLAVTTALLTTGITSFRRRNLAL